tara:strand:+ start:1212 stop:2306 length:1095 start_codon:yes stop_codon:yes gene_type:complete
MSKAAELAALIGSGQAQGNKNRIINGAMQVNQRGDTTGVTTSQYGGPDRFKFGIATAGTFDISQSTTAPNGFANSYKLDCTTADASLAAGDLVAAQTRIEGQDLQQLKKGTSDAESVTLSFYVRSNKTGTYALELLDNHNNRQVTKTYTISSADTFEYKSITFPADTTGPFNDNNSTALTVLWWLGAGTNYTSGTATGSWAASTSANRAVGLNVNIADNTANEWLITGVQLEVGEQATPFEHRSFGDELARCQRYYWQLSQSVHGSYPSWIATAYSTTQLNVQIPFPVTMRSIPTMTYNTGNVNYYRFYRNSANHNFGTVGTDTATSEHINLYGTATSSHTAGTSGTLQIRLADGAGVFASAEL